MISIINEGLKEHFKKHGRKYIGGALALGGAALGGAAYGQAKEGIEEIKKSVKKAKEGVGKLAVGGLLSGAGVGIAAPQRKKKELRNQKR